MTDALKIYYEHHAVAEVTSDKALELRYVSEWTRRRGAFPISLSMPLRDKPYGADAVLPWLANLLPERHLTEISQQLRVSPQDVVGILASIGRDTAGALSIGSPRGQSDEWREIGSETELERIIEELPSKPFLVGERGVSMSLAGVQEKLPVSVVDGTIRIPIEGTPSTHILKPDSKNLAASVQNEAYCLALARACGLPVPGFTTGIAGKRQYLLVDRYDRIVRPDGITRVHQEDFCQILRRFPSDKYERAAFGRATGPSVTDMLGAIKDLSTPGQRLPFLDGVIFNVLACNTDSHAKNYSMLIGAGGSSRMAPLYDILCAKIYQRVDQMLPQAINGKRDPDTLGIKDWQALAESVGLSPATTVQRVLDLATRVLDKAQQAKAEVEAMPARSHAKLEDIVRAVTKRATRIHRQAANGVPTPKPTSAGDIGTPGGSGTPGTERRRDAARGVCGLR